MALQSRRKPIATYLTRPTLGQHFTKRLTAWMSETSMIWLDAVRLCFASLFKDRAIAYRVDKGFDHLNQPIEKAIARFSDARWAERKYVWCTPKLRVVRRCEMFPRPEKTGKNTA
jgi:hypothetical protein